jgi:hypothetical protein
MRDLRHAESLSGTADTRRRSLRGWSVLTTPAAA